MAFSIGHLLTAAGQGASGYLQGKTEADQRREERERQARQEAMQQSMFDYRKEQDTLDRTRQATLDEQNERNQLADEFYRRQADMLARGKERTAEGERARARPYDEAQSRAQTEALYSQAAASRRGPEMPANSQFNRLRENAVAHFRQKLRSNYREDADGTRILTPPRAHSVQIWIQQAQEQFPGLSSGDLMTALQAAQDTEGEAAPWDVAPSTEPTPAPAPAPQPPVPQPAPRPAGAPPDTSVVGEALMAPPETGSGAEAVARYLEQIRRNAAPPKFNINR